MRHGLKGLVVGMLAIAGVAMASAEAQAMPAPNLGSPAVSGATSLDKVWWRGGYGWRGYGWRGHYGYGWRRPFYGYGWGWRRPFYGYGFHRRYWGWRRW